MHKVPFPALVAASGVPRLMTLVLLLLLGWWPQLGQAQLATYTIQKTTAGSPLAGTSRGNLTIGNRAVRPTVTFAASANNFAVDNWGPDATNDLSTLNVLSTSNPLPVELAAPTAQRRPTGAVVVHWATASEQNSARFELQRSLNGKTFATVATAPARGASTQPTSYAGLDRTAPATRLYYRLRQVDLDGTVVLSPVVTVTSRAETLVALYPNPTHTALHFEVAGAMPYRVLNQVGQFLLHGTTDVGTATVEVEGLVPGLYLLELLTPAGRLIRKFEKE